MSSAKAGVLYADRLEVLDRQLSSLQQLLVLVGRNIRAGAQQQQVSS